MFKKTTLCALMLSALAALSQNYPYVVPNIDWIQYYSQGTTVVNAPTTIDANNNVYTAGYSGTTTSACNLIVQKRDSLGSIVYTKVYNNGAYDKANALKLRGQDAYVAGVSYGNGATLNDFVVLRVNGTGSYVYTPFRYDYFGQDDEAVDVVADGSGNTYAVGWGKTGLGDKDIICVKINSSGVQQWTHVFPGTSGMDEVPTGMVLIGSSLYITGSRGTGSNGTDIITYQINTNTGLIGWSATQINGTANGNDKPNGITTSGADVIVCAEIDNTSTGLDAVLIRYNGSSGSVVYQQAYDYGSAANRATSLVRDSTGNIAMVGTALSSSIYQYHTVFFDSTGTQLWVNIENTGLTSVSVDPRIATDTIANHFYVCGEKLYNSKDIYVYQITPTGNTSWTKHIDGQNNDIDAATGLAVNGIGVVYLGALSKNTVGNYYDYTTIKISQTPVYFPPDVISNEKPSASHLYYENNGQVVNSSNGAVANNILFSTMEYYYPVTYFEATKIHYKLFKHDTASSGTDTTQRITIEMFGANQLADAYPFNPNHGLVSYMQQGLPDAVTGVRGFERYFIPNIYPSIDLHYYSNENGLKMYYVLKPYADPTQIQWEITGATSSTINGSGNLQLNGFNKSITFQYPKIYTVDMYGNVQTLTTTASWQYSGTYGFSLTPYNTAWPLIIEIDYSNNIATVSPQDNVAYCTYYGGGSDDGFNDIDVDKNNGNYVVLGLTKSSTLGTQFPTVSGTTVSIATNSISNRSYFTIVLFDAYGVRKAVNTYGGLAYSIYPLKAILNGNLITVVGNTGLGGAGSLLPVYTSIGNLSASCYSTNVNGDGFVLQFQHTSNGNINKITWNGRLNGSASDIDKTPDGKYIYIASASDVAPSDCMSQTGSYNNSNVTTGGQGAINLKVSKFDSLGVRKWATMIPIISTQYVSTPHNQFDNSTSSILTDDTRLKCRIACDNYGFYLASESNDVGNQFNYSMYGAPSNAPNGFKDAVFARFNKKDALVYASYFGGASGDEAFNDIAIVGPNDVVVTGYSNSWDSWQSYLFKPSATGYVDTTIANIPTFSPPFINGAIAKMYVARFDSIGNLKWGTFYGNSTTGECIGWGVTTDNTGKIFVTGKDRGSFVFPFTNPSGLYSQSSINQTESFMLAFDGGNNVVWDTRFGSTANEIGLDLEYNPVSDVMIKTGITNSGSSFPITISNSYPPNTWYQPNIGTGAANNYDGYIAHFKTNVVTGINEFLNDKKRTEAFGLFPNPARNQCTLAFKSGLKGKAKIEVFNQMGQLVGTEERDEITANSLVNLNTQSFSNGMYIVKVSGSENSFSQKLIINK